MSINLSVTVIEKDSKGHIGIAIGGGYPICKSIYIVQIFEGSPSANNKEIQVGDDILGINGKSVVGLSKNQVANLIQSAKGKVKIAFLPLEQSINEEQTLDIAFKKIKHRIVEFLDSETADALGLSRAILCNDLLLQSLQKMEHNTVFYDKLVSTLNCMTKNSYGIAKAQSKISTSFCEIAAKTNNSVANNLYTAFGEGNKNMIKVNQNMGDKIAIIEESLKNYGEKAIPDTKEALKRYLDAKFEYLSYCLKVKEMEDEEIDAIQNNFYLERLDFGNFEYKAVLRCRETAKSKFVDQRERALIKIEMLNEKHNRDLAIKLKELIEGMKDSYDEGLKILADHFPSEGNYLNDITYAALTTDTQSKDDKEETKVEDCEDFINMKDEVTENTKPESDELLIFLYVFDY
uniref:PRKCA-binding protein n=1 Tax=Rhabditophanes sp. KR3021 TaxID=114890 RepID=A0AC35U7Y7_9BILA